MTDLEIARALRAAAEYLRTHGWMQGSYGGHGGERCLVGALASATGYRLYYPLAELAREEAEWRPIECALGFDGARNVFAIADWNDVRGRTAEEVIDRLESAALNLEIKALAASTESLAAERLELVGNIS